jgi:hypothetical protein
LKLTVQSKEEDKLNGRVTLQIMAEALDSIYLVDTRFKSQAREDHPLFSSLGVPPFVKYKLFTKADLFSLSYTLVYDQNEQPYHPQEVEFEVEFFTPDNVIVIAPPKNPHPSRDEEFTGDPVTLTVMAHLYFTPYSTLEVWSDEDFYNLKRIWLEDTGDEKQRISVSPDSIPESNLPMDVNLESEPWNDHWNMVFIPGLAYAIPMKRTTPPELINEENNIGARDGCGFPRQRFTYRITGNLRSSIINDHSVPVDINLSGLELNFYENDFFRDLHTPYEDQYLGATRTDENGNFDFSINICQDRITEGNSIEVYIVVRAEDPHWQVSAKTTFNRIDLDNPPLYTRRSIIELPPLPHNGDARNLAALGSININDRSHRSVVFIKHALEFSNNNDVEVPGRINLFPYFPMSDGSQGFFVPPNLAYIWPVPVIASLVHSTPSIFLSTDGWGTGDENTTYHEFGHYLMWKLQQQNWLDPHTASFGEYSSDAESNSNIAWTEGWADGFMAMCDMANYQVDEEFQRDQVRNYERQLIHEDVFVGYKNLNYIRSSIFDLFDGSDKFSVFNIPTGPGTEDYDFDDFNYSAAGVHVWNNHDNVSLTLRQICQPLMDQTPLHGGLLHDVDDYFHALTKDLDCQALRDIKIIFDNNNLLADVNDPSSGFSTDQIGFVREEIDRFDIQAPLQEFFFIDENVLSGDEWSFNFVNPHQVSASVVLNPRELISDNLEIRNGATLYFNKDEISGFYNQFPSPFKPTPSSTVYPLICNQTEVLVEDGGKMILGDATVSNAAVLWVWSEAKVEVGEGGTLIIEPGSKLIVQRDATLILRSGSTLWLQGESLLTIQGGGWLCVEDGASIILQDPASRLILDDGSQMGVHSIWARGHNCLKPDAIEFTGDGGIGPWPGNALTFDGTDDRVTFPNVDELNLGDFDDFTIEVFFQSYFIGQAPTYQTLLSKRSFRNMSEADGFILGIWPGEPFTGKVFAQFNGTPNYLSESQNLFDGACHYIALTRKENEVTFYVDGISYGSQLSYRSLNSTSPLYAGYDPPEGINFKGEIAEIRFWNLARTSDQIADYENEFITGNETGLMCAWQFNQASGEVALDSSPNLFHANLGNEPEPESFDPMWYLNRECEIPNYFSGNWPDKFVLDAVPDRSTKDTIQYEPKLKAWPIPFDREVTLLIESDEDESMELKVYDENGLEVLSTTEYRTNEIIHLEKGLKKGIYVVKARFGNKVKEMKIIKMN